MNCWISRKQIADETTVSRREEAQGLRGLHHSHREIAMTIAGPDLQKSNLLYASCTSLSSTFRGDLMSMSAYCGVEIDQVI